MEWQLQHALELARTNPIIGLPKMAATIYRRGQLISTGLNQLRSHPLQKRFGRTADCIYLHAEIAAIKNAVKSQDIAGATIYVARALKNGTPGLAKPCCGCERALVEFDLNVEWTI